VAIRDIAASAAGGLWAIACGSTTMLGRRLRLAEGAAEFVAQLEVQHRRFSFGAVRKCHDHKSPQDNSPAGPAVSSGSGRRIGVEALTGLDAELARVDVALQQVARMRW
jgi:hypothetical protein